MQKTGYKGVKGAAWRKWWLGTWDNVLQTQPKGLRSRDPCYVLSTYLVLAIFHITSNHSTNACKLALSFHLLDEEIAVQRDYVPYSRSHS